MKKNFALAAVACAAAVLSVPLANACTRVLYETGTGNFIVGRTMDWYDDTATDLWAFPRGMARDGGVGPGSIQWTSKYGSIVGDIYDAGSADGMNEAGLVTNVLYLAESDYGDARATGKPLLSIGAWGQYILDNYGSVAEAVAGLQTEPFAIIAPALPGGKAAAGHIAIADASGDSAIFEYLQGKLVIHHGREHKVMTNSPPFDEQLAINTYWNDVGGLKFLPGTHRAADRFARVGWNLRATPQVKDQALAVATVFSIIRNISVPLGISDPEKPNIAATLWRTVADTKERRYYFESAFSPSVFWVDMSKLNLAAGFKPSKLDLSNKPILSGEVSGKFAAAEPFKFLSH
ncbi:linear amide C-N hydrolase [Melaminivora sp.]|uniref:linear amide C-N hydrolase n=1 Tax=Melaminivora sp. TaxID=1933032 RepID=UPI0028A93D8D|nr:linear amide C-N hydrolase [Melaminivora sp.]